MIAMMTPLEELIDETRLLWHALIAAAERLHAKERVTLGMRAVLEFLLVQGPVPVPEIARRRGVSRQHIQGLVNALLAENLVAVQENPAHRRSVLIGLTTNGERTIRRMKEREARLFAEKDFGAGQAEMKRAAKVLRGVRSALGGQK